MNRKQLLKEKDLRCVWNTNTTHEDVIFNNKVVFHSFGFFSVFAFALQFNEEEKIHGTSNRI